MGAGQYNRKVVIESSTDVENGSGGYTQTWATTATVFANATPIGGTEGIIAGTLQGSQSWRIRMRYRSLSVKQRLQMDGKQLNIVSVEDPTGQRREIVVFAEFQPS
jgi:SPP1 family predicted phage head-tail adaptor